MGYYEGTANEPLEAVSAILRMLQYSDRSEIQFYNESSGKTVDINNYAECISPLSFSVTLDGKDGQIYMLAGAAVNRGSSDLSKPVWDAGAELELVEI
jgi:hypothetical protein